MNQLDLNVLFSAVKSVGNDDAHEGVNWYLWSGEVVFLGHFFVLILDLVSDLCESG